MYDETKKIAHDAQIVRAEENLMLSHDVVNGIFRQYTLSTSVYMRLMLFLNNRPHIYNPFLVYCRELAPGTVSLTGDRAQGDDSKHDSHYNSPRLQ